ncbi:hypothetical protein ET495_06230 [Xylanimonas allomyrinae]|uniref:Uncharacterized protein n=1 Tax=Xylanimonas allomyrinae TaxID=2509459 RepID=A0A4P6ERB4_9MICO|nr:hypothetical protein [Xylanimonas allomyrinae]QAY62907.1 hypothetical protein ET495_06230 [Xylanimonas allomyrinae]
MNRRAPLTSALAALVMVGLTTGCTVAPSGRLDTAPNGGLPSEQPSPPAPVSDLPTFDASSAVGGYAEGFPRSLLEAPDDASIIASSAGQADGGLTRVSLSLSTPRTADDVLAQLGGPLATNGFTETPQAPSGLTAQTAWTRRTERPEGPLVETLLIGVLDEGDHRLVSVSGTVLAPTG